MHVTVEAGIHLGHDPNDKHSTEENSLLYQLSKLGLAVEDLGGITHQTVGGFLCTGSSGGSLKFSVLDNIQGLRIVDGTGNVYTVCRDDANQDDFHAALVSLGVLGVLSRITFKCVPAFNIKGQQLISPPEQSEVDIYNDKPLENGVTGLNEFLTGVDYSQILWWPQLGENERLQVWQANRIPSTPDFTPEPFKLFPNPEIMIIYSYVMTLLGNIDDMNRVRQIANISNVEFRKIMKAELQKHNVPEKYVDTLLSILEFVNKFLLLGFVDLIDHIPPNKREDILPGLSALSIKLFTAFEPKIEFHDYGWHGLPMDNTADDIIVPTMFTEIWIPLTYATKATNTLKDYFRRAELEHTKASASTIYSHTGNNAWELYAAKPSNAWMSMSYSNGDDIWKEGAFRIDPFWCTTNSGDPYDLYSPVWELFNRHSIPFRLHWGKLFPKMHTKSELNWRDILIHSQYPCLQKFLAFRESKDPKGIFLTNFWRYWLGI